MSDTVKAVIAGVIGIAMITAFGLHARQLSTLPKPTGQAVSGVLNTAEVG